MHIVVRAGEGAAEGHAVLQVVDVGAAADGVAVALLSSELLIAPQQGLDEGGVLRDAVGGMKWARTVKPSSSRPRVSTRSCSSVSETGTRQSQVKEILSPSASRMFRQMVRAPLSSS